MYVNSNEKEFSLLFSLKNNYKNLFTYKSLNDIISTLGDINGVKRN